MEPKVDDLTVQSLSKKSAGGCSNGPRSLAQNRFLIFPRHEVCNHLNFSRLRA